MAPVPVVAGTALSASMALRSAGMYLPWTHMTKKLIRVLTGITRKPPENLRQMDVPFKITTTGRHVNSCSIVHQLIEFFDHILPGPIGIVRFPSAFTKGEAFPLDAVPKELIDRHEQRSTDYRKKKKKHSP